MSTDMDIQVYNEGTVIGFEPTSDIGAAWIRDNVQAEPWQWLGGMLCVDHRMAWDLVVGMRGDGLVVGGVEDSVEDDDGDDDE